MSAEGWSWVDFAACRDVDPHDNPFFPDYPLYPRKKWPPRVRAKFETIDNTAKAICAGCPVREQCLEWALTYPEITGTWGGLTAFERPRNPTERRPTCGSRNGFMHHWRHNETPCDPCKAASNEYTAGVKRGLRLRKRAA